MTKEEKNLLLALSLGDGYISPSFYKPKRKKTALNSSITIAHCPQQKSYLDYKARLLDKIIGGNTNINKGVSYAKGKPYDYYRICRGHRYFGILRKYLYQNGKKVITPKAIERLSPLGLAIWYLDDGCLYTRTDAQLIVSIAVGMDQPETTALARVILEKWNIKFRVRRLSGNCKKFGLECSTEESIKFLNIIRDPVEKEIKCLQYKVNLDKREALLTNKKRFG